MQTNDVEHILDEICCSDLVLSTSLHGIIFAHSFGVPAYHIVANSPESIDFYKYKDYYSVLDIDYQNYRLNFKNDEEVFKRLYESRSEFTPSKEIIDKIQEDLMTARPDESELHQPTACLCAIAKNENNYIRE